MKKQQKPAGIIFTRRNYLSYLIKVGYDLIEQTEALQSFLIDIRLGVELFKVRDGGEHHTHRLVRLVIKVLMGSNREITAGRSKENAKVRASHATPEDLRAQR